MDIYFERQYITRPLFESPSASSSLWSLDFTGVYIESNHVKVYIFENLGRSFTSCEKLVLLILYFKSRMQNVVALLFVRFDCL